MTHSPHEQPRSVWRVVAATAASLLPMPKPLECSRLPHPQQAWKTPTGPVLACSTVGITCTWLEASRTATPVQLGSGHYTPTPQRHTHTPQYTTLGRGI